MQYPCWGAERPQDVNLKTALLTSLVYAVRTVFSDVESQNSCYGIESVDLQV